MKKKVIAGMAAWVVAVFSACYQEIEPTPPQERGGLLPIAGAYNVRDIGGYTGAEGKQVKYGKLIRSGDLNLLTQRDQDYLFGTLGIQTVVDFRSKKKTVNSYLNPQDNQYYYSVSIERESSPDRLPSAGVTVVWQNTAIEESLVVPDYESILSDSRTYPDVQSVTNKVIEGYEHLVTGGAGENARAQYKAFFKALLESEGSPVLYHCSAGKDRTGVATALLLGALGVSRRDIIDNYMLSAEFVAEKYYPVVPFVIKTYKENMLKMQKLAFAIDQGGPAETHATNSLTASTTSSEIRKKMEELLNDGTNRTKEAAQTEAETYVNTYMQAAIGQIVAGTKQGIAGLKTKSEADLQQDAEGTGEKVRPLLTVKEEYIEAALDAITTGFPDAGGFNASIEKYLTTTSGGLGLSSDDIKDLKKLYLE